MAEQDEVDYKRLLYKADIKFSHERDKDGNIPYECTTWYDGCNCIIPYDDFDSAYYDRILRECAGNG